MSAANFFNEANEFIARHAAEQAATAGALPDDGPAAEPSKPATTKPTRATKPTQAATVNGDRVAISPLAGIDPGATVRDCVGMVRLLATLTPENLQDPKARHGLITILNLLDRQLIALKVNP